MTRWPMRWMGSQPTEPGYVGGGRDSSRVGFDSRPVGVSATQWPNLRGVGGLARLTIACMAEAPTGWEIGH